MAITSIEQLKAECTPDVLAAYAEEVLTGFTAELEELKAQIQEAATVEPELEPEPEQEVVAESDTTKIETRLAAVEMRERQADAREVLQVALAESNLIPESKKLVARRFVDSAPEDKAKFTETVNDEVKAMAEHDKAIAESVRLPGTPGVLTEAGNAEPIDVEAGILKASGLSQEV